LTALRLIRARWSLNFPPVLQAGPALRAKLAVPLPLAPVL
jgi:hypothetical protein